MGATSIWHWIVVGLVVMLFFGRGKISEMMGDVAKGIKAFKKGMADDDTATTTTTVTPAQPGEAGTLKTIEHQTVSGTPAATVTTERKLG